MPTPPDIDMMKSRARTASQAPAVPKQAKLKAFARLLSAILDEPEEVILASLLTQRNNVPPFHSSDLRSV